MTNYKTKTKEELNLLALINDFEDLVWVPDKDFNYLISILS